MRIQKNYWKAVNHSTGGPAELVTIPILYDLFRSYYIHRDNASLQPFPAARLAVFSGDLTRIAGGGGLGKAKLKLF